jgi:hypothetical protein
LSSKKWGYWQLQQGYSTPVLLAKEIPWCTVVVANRVEMSIKKESGFVKQPFTGYFNFTDL